MQDKWYLNTYSIVLFFVVGAAIATSSLFLLLIPQSSEIIRLAEWRMLRAQSFKTEVNLQYHGTRDEIGQLGVVKRERQDLNLDLRGVLLRHEEGTDGDFDFRALFGSRDPIVVAGEYSRADREDYLVLTELPDNLGGVNVGFFRGRTLRVDFDDLLPSTNLPFVGGTDRLDQYDRAYLLSEARQMPFLRVEEKLKNEIMRGAEVHHYKVMPEKLYLREFIVLAEQLRQDRELTGRERIAWDTFFTHVTPLSSEIWIGSGDYYIHRLRLQFGYDNGEREGIVTLTAEFSEFNQPQVIEKPSAGQFDEAAAYLESIIGGLAAHLPMAKAGSARKVEQGASSLGELAESDDGGKAADDDDDGLPAFLEIFYGADVLNPDTDGDGLRDGYEVDTGWSPTGPWRLFDFTFGAFD